MVGLREAVQDLPDPAAADLFENEDAYLLVIDLPGATAEQTSIGTTDGRITVGVERIANGPDVATPVQEERPDEFRFELPLPADADADAARASLADGVLELTIPRDTSGISIPIEDG